MNLKDKELCIGYGYNEQGCNSKDIREAVLTFQTLLNLKSSNKDMLLKDYNQIFGDWEK